MDFIKILIVVATLCGLSLSVSVAGAGESECSGDTDPVADCLPSTGNADSALGEDEAEDDMFVILPHLEDRELGEPNIDEEGAPVIWDHPLPFLVRR